MHRRIDCNRIWAALCTNVSLIESLAHCTINVRVFARIYFNSCLMNRCTRAVSRRPFRLIATCKMHFTLDGHVDISLVVELSTSMLCCVINSNNNEQQTITSVRNIICQSHGEMDCIDDASRSLSSLRLFIVCRSIGNRIKCYVNTNNTHVNRDAFPFSLLHNRNTRVAPMCSSYYIVFESNGT